MSDDCQKSFDKLKAYLEVPVPYPQLDKEFKLAVDASMLVQAIFCKKMTMVLTIPFVIC